MVDIHCHILPGIDDGAESIEISLQMAETAIADGITHVVATPHANSVYTFELERIRELRDQLQAQVGNRLTLVTGCDFHFSYENLQGARQNPHKYTINQKNYLLVEFADYSIPPTIDDTLHQLQLAGLRPIVTHPERNPLIRANPQKLTRWVERGCYVQVTALSLLGRFGPSAQRAADRWLAEDCIHFFASDAHNVTGRPLKLREAFEVVAQRRGTEVAQALFRDNPLAALEGRPLPYVPEPLSSENSGSTPRRRKRFIFF